MVQRDYDYNKDILDSLLEHGLIDKELYEKCNDNDYNITIDDVKGIKMNVDGIIKQINETTDEYVGFVKDNYELIEKYGMVDYSPTYLDKLKEIKKSGDKWLKSLADKKNWKFCRDDENSFINRIDSFIDGIRHHRKEVNSIPIEKKEVVWDKKNKQMYINFLNTLEDQLKELKKIVRGKIIN